MAPSSSPIDPTTSIDSLNSQERRFNDDKRGLSRKSLKKPDSTGGSNVKRIGESGTRRKKNAPSGSAYTPASNRKSPPKPINGLKKEKENNGWSTSESESDESEVTFQDYTLLCERVAKTMYYTNTRPSVTPRPSLPLTVLAVDTFSKYARKDTLEFLDIDMAADIGRNACVSPTALVFALVYLERLSMNNPGYLKTVKPSELFVVSLLVASKFVQDDGEDLGIFNDEWATSANMELSKLNQLELEFLTAIDWKVNIGKGKYERALKRIEEKVALQQGLRRGWFTYTELKSLTQSYLTWHAVLPTLYDRVVEVASAICVMYTTLFATLITSSTLAPYLLSISKSLIMLSQGSSSSMFVETSLASCLQDISMQNSSLSVTQLHGTTPTENIQRLVPAEHLLPSLEDLENETDTSAEGFASGHSWNQQTQKVLVRHRRFYETANENYGYSFKCDSGDCYHYSQEETLANVQRVLENILQSSNILNPDIDYGRRFGHVNQGFDCSYSGKCFKSSMSGNLQGSRPIRV